MTGITSSHALYIHWPFCKKKCPYCDFNSHVRENVAEDDWQKAMLSELRWYASQAAPRPLSSIFFGGGTPSLMPPRIAAALIAEAEKLFGFTDECEITLEANPTSTENAKLQDLRAAGVNRLSLGVQSLRENHLKFLGREHSAMEATEAIELAARIFPRYSFDLIYALPNQSLVEWREDLCEALQMAGDHLSLYQLTIEQGTQFYHHHRSGKLVMPSDELTADFYEATQEIMEAAKMPAYEISNHARAGGEARHNVHIWQGGSYLGIGAGAHGRMENAAGERFATFNRRSPEAWLEHALQHGHANEVFEKLSDRERVEERILMGLRLREGLTLPAHHWSPNYLQSLTEEGLITYDSQRITPTARGRMLLNSLTTNLAANLVENL